MDKQREKEIRKVRQREYFRSKLNNVHHHKIRKLSLGTYNLAMKEVEGFNKILNAEKKNKAITFGMNAVEKQWAKRKSRKKLQQTHRKLESGWAFLNPIRKLLPRQVNLGNYKPDYVFYFCNILFLFALTMDFGMHTALASYELMLVKIEAIPESPFSERFTKLPLLSFVTYHYLTTVILFTVTLAAIPSFYVGIVENHWAYFFIMIGTNILKTIISSILRVQDLCPQIGSVIGDKLTKLVRTYYEAAVAIDESGRKVTHANGSDFYLRTHTSAFLMDKIQRRIGCCGSNSFKDYFVRSSGPGSELWVPEVPQSCCTNIWNQNPSCAKEIPKDLIELGAKIYQSGCKIKLFRVCENAHRTMTQQSINILMLHLVLFLICCTMMAVQLRQIRQLIRPTHFKIPWNAANKGLMVGESVDKYKLDGMLNLDPDDVELPQELLDTIKQFRANLGLDTLGHKIKLRPPTPPPPVELVELEELPYIPGGGETNKPPVKRIINRQMNMLGKTTAEQQVQERSRFDIFELNDLKPYYKGIFSATYAQENRAAKNMILNQMRKNINQNQLKDTELPKPPPKNNKTISKVKTEYRYMNPVNRTQKNATKSDKGMKPSLLVTNKRNVLANPQPSSEPDPPAMLPDHLNAP